MSVRPLTPSPAGLFRLASDEVHSWCARLDVSPETSARLSTTLSSDERTRSTRFQFERDRERFIVAHGVLRDLLGGYLGIPPGRISYAYNAFGKPELSSECGHRLRFNLSHSAGLALIVIAHDAHVGVDLEYIRAHPDHVEIARHFFSAAEADQLTTLPNHLYTEAFFGCWTKKEAYLKGCGQGLAIPLTSFSVPLTTDPEHSPVDFQLASHEFVPTRGWSFYTLHPAPGYLGAVAIEGSGWRLSERQWTSGEP